MLTDTYLGIGYSSPDKNRIPPPNPTGHAWNAVRLDDGQWKLIDCCWGAGHIRGGTQQYFAEFDPKRFTQSNEDFGIDHFPEKPGHFFRADGRALSWTEYILLDADMPRTLGSWEVEGWRRQSLEPRCKAIRVPGPASNEMIRFAFTKVCAHWDYELVGKGKPFLPFIEYHGRGGAKKEQTPMNTDGYNYWLDISTADLGTPGQEIKLITMSQLDGNEARGLTKEAYERWMAEPRGKSWSWEIKAVWDLS